jgi:hypothetical protein
MEELHSDLIPYSDDGIVHHPLIVASLLRDASHINQVYPRPPLVAKGRTDKRDIAAYFGDRNEREIVSMRVSIISVTDISQVP